MKCKLNIQYRLAAITDIEKLQNLISLSARGLSVNYYSEVQIESALSYVFGVDTQLIADKTYFIAEWEGNFIGCGGWSKRKTLYGGDQFKHTEPDPLIDPSTEAARIRAFFIHPDWGRKGVGKGLLHACSEAARQAGFRNLELGSTLPGVPFYSAMGFAQQEQSEVPLPNGVKLPIVRMTKSL